MKINIIYTLYIFIVIVLFSCSLDEEPLSPYRGEVFIDPVFKVAGTVNQNPIDIQAGKENFYMYTDYEIDGDDVVTYIGKFAAEDGLMTTGDEELTFYIRGSSLTSGGGSTIDEILMAGDLIYSSLNSSQTATYRYNFTSTVLNNLVNSSHTSLWEFANGDTTTQDNPSIIVNSDSPFTVNLTTFTPGISIDYQGRVSPNINSDSTLLLDLQYSLGGNGDVTIIVQNLNLNFLWSTGATTDSISLSLSDINPDGELFSVTATNSYGHSGLASLFVRPPSGASALSIEVLTSYFTYEVSEILTQSLDLNTVVIEYKKDGEFYSSNLGGQNQLANKFSIISIEEFNKNENGFPTKKLQIGFDCLLFNDAGDSIPFTGNGVIGVAYPD